MVRLCGCVGGNLPLSSTSVLPPTHPQTSPQRTFKPLDMEGWEILQELDWFGKPFTAYSHFNRLDWAASVRMLVRLSANDPPPRPSLPGPIAQSPHSWRSSLKLRAQFLNGLPNWFQTFIECLFSWSVTITRQGIYAQVDLRFSSFKPNYYKRLEPDLYRDKNSQYTDGWQNHCFLKFFRIG